MLQAIRPSRRSRVSIPATIPAPVGGLNARDSIADMPVQDALILTNIFPEETFCAVRQGNIEHASGLTNVETLFTYNGATGTDLFAAGGNAIYDVSSSGAVGAAEVSGLSSDRWQYINFSNAAGNWIFALNGVDTPYTYNGTSWATTSISGSGLTSSNLIYPASHKERIWMVEKDTMNAWYLPTQAISGTATKFPLGSVFNRGGKLNSIGSFSVDAGDGIDDYAVFLSSEGDVAVYQGTDPSSASTWSLVGVYEAAKPIGQRPLARLGGNLLIVTWDGVISLTQLMKMGRAGGKYADVTNKIAQLINEDALLYSGNFGWELTIYPNAKYLILNIPRSENVTQIQYVMNILTGSWCKFEGMNANTWVNHNDGLYFGGAGGVYQADNGYKDDGNDIDAELKTAFNYFRSKGQRKQFKMVRPIIESNGDPSYSIGIDVDYENNEPGASLSANIDQSTVWDTGVWDTALWGAGINIVKTWKTTKGLGMCAAAHLKVKINGQSCKINAFDMLFERGGIL